MSQWAKCFNTPILYTTHIHNTVKHELCVTLGRGGSRAAATSKMERFVIIVNGFQPLTIITKRSILDVAAALDPPLLGYLKPWHIQNPRHIHNTARHLS